MTSTKIDRTIVECYVKIYIDLVDKGRSTESIADRLTILLKRLKKDNPQ